MADGDSICPGKFARRQGLYGSTERGPTRAICKSGVAEQSRASAVWSIMQRSSYWFQEDKDGWDHLSCRVSGCDFGNSIVFRTALKESNHGR